MQVKGTCSVTTMQMSNQFVWQATLLCVYVNPDKTVSTQAFCQTSCFTDDSLWVTPACRKAVSLQTHTHTRKHSEMGSHSHMGPSLRSLDICQQTVTGLVALQPLQRAKSAWLAPWQVGCLPGHLNRLTEPRPSQLPEPTGQFSNWLIFFLCNAGRL